jgi:hypothetical protein
MSDQWQDSERRLLELLADRAVFGLTPREEHELSGLEEAIPDFDSGCMERAAATVQLAFTSVEPLPAAVRAKVRASGMQYVSKPLQE